MAATRSYRRVAGDATLSSSCPRLLFISTADAPYPHLCGLLRRTFAQVKSCEDQACKNDHCFCYSDSGKSNGEREKNETSGKNGDMNVRPVLG